MWPFRKKKPTFSENREAMRRLTERAKQDGLEITICFGSVLLPNPEILFRPNPPQPEQHGEINGLQ